MRKKYVTEQSVHDLFPSPHWTDYVLVSVHLLSLCRYFKVMSALKTLIFLFSSLQISILTKNSACLHLMWSFLVERPNGRSVPSCSKGKFSTCALGLFLLFYYYSRQMFLVFYYHFLHGNISTLLCNYSTWFIELTLDKLLPYPYAYRPMDGRVTWPWTTRLFYPQN